MVEITRKDLNRSFWRWMFFSHSNYNYERLQSMGVTYALSPILKKLYHNKPDELKEALQRHLQFFNTEPSFGDPILSISIAMEEQKANGQPIPAEMIEGFKTGMMGPLAGVGDTLFQGIIIPILLSFTIPFATEGNIILGPFAYGVLLLGIMLPIAHWLWMTGYYTGRQGILELLHNSLLQKVMMFAQILGAVVIGALTAKFVTVSTPLAIPLGRTSLNVQKKVLDELSLGILPLAVTLATYWMLKKKLKPTTVLLILIVGAAVLGAFGIIKA